MKPCFIFGRGGSIRVSQSQEHHRLLSHLPHAFSRTSCLSPFRMQPSNHDPEEGKNKKKQKKQSNKKRSQSISQQSAVSQSAVSSQQSESVSEIGNEEERLALKTESTESLRLSIRTLNRLSSCSSSCKSAVEASRVQILSACDC